VRKRIKKVKSKTLTKGLLFRKSYYKVKKSIKKVEKLIIIINKYLKTLTSIELRKLSNNDYRNVPKTSLVHLVLKRCNRKKSQKVNFKTKNYKTKWLKPEVKDYSRFRTTYLIVKRIKKWVIKDFCLRHPTGYQVCQWICRTSKDNLNLSGTVIRFKQCKFYFKDLIIYKLYKSSYNQSIYADKLTKAVKGKKSGSFRQH
jgi:hypothetical protein